MIKARASGSKVYLYFMKKGRQARHRIPRNSCIKKSKCILEYKCIFTEWKNVVLERHLGFANYTIIGLVSKMLEILIGILFMFNVFSSV